MELRGCSQVHFISVIRGGEVIKMHNIARGKSVLKFKNIEDIYGSDGSECQELLLGSPPTVKRPLAIPNGEVEANARVKIECIEEDIEVDFGSITLKQLKRTCKSKRNAQKPVKMAAVQQEVLDLSCEDDELELKETLVSWKRKVLKNAKSKKKKKTSNCDSLVTEIRIIDSIVEDTPKSLALIDTSSEIYKPLQVKVEDPEPSYTQLEAKSYILGVDHLNSTGEILSSIESCSSDQALNSNIGDLQSGYLTQCLRLYPVHPKPVDTEKCILNQFSYELKEHIGQDSVTPESSSFDEIMLIDGSEVTNQPSVCGVSEFPEEEGMNDPMTCGESPERVLPESTRFDEILLIEGSKVTDQPSVCSGSEFPGEEGMNDPMTCDKSPVRVLPACDHPTVDCVASSDKFTSVVDEKELAVADVTSTELQSSNCHNGDIQAESVFGSHLQNCNPTEQDINFLSSASGDVTSLSSTTSLAGEECSSVDNYVAPLSCLPVLESRSTVEEPTGSATSEGNDSEMMPHPPERLFSTRKIISPTCQERLRKCMNVDEQQDGVEIRPCEKNLEFEKNEAVASTLTQDVRRVRFVCSSEKPRIMNAEELQNNSTQRIRRGKRKRNPRGSADGTQVSPMSQNLGNNCSSLQTCSQNAIAFSQRQVHDIDRIARKLMTGLQSMKSIVVDALQHESRMGTKFRYDTDQVRVAVENVTKTEEKAQKWLSMMSRDCDRFCKIMTLAEADAPSPEKPKGDNPSSPDTKIVPKQRKIMFADEAGGSLCIVKVFENIDDDMDFDNTPVKRHCMRGEA